jgi:hypothetical protein
MVMNAKTKFNGILKDTKKLVELAELGEWDDLISLEKKRELAIKNLFNHQPDIELFYATVCNTFCKKTKF